MLVGREIKQTPWRWRGIINALVQKYKKRGTVQPGEWDETFFRYAHQFCEASVKEIHHKAHVCGCFYCCSIFNPKETKEDNGYEIIPNVTFCPCCHTDSVIYDAPGVPITEEFLKAMKEHYF